MHSDEQKLIAVRKAVIMRCEEIARQKRGHDFMWLDNYRKVDLRTLACRFAKSLPDLRSQLNARQLRRLVFVIFTELATKGLIRKSSHGYWGFDPTKLPLIRATVSRVGDVAKQQPARATESYVNHPVAVALSR